MLSQTGSSLPTSSSYSSSLPLFLLTSSFPLYFKVLLQTANDLSQRSESFIFVPYGQCKFEV